MQAGQLRHRLTFESQTQVKNKFGEFVSEWDYAFEVWGAIEPAVGKSYFDAKQLTAQVDGKIRIRYRDDVKPTMHIIHRDRILEIVSLLIPKERNEEIVIYYKEKLD